MNIRFGKWVCDKMLQGPAEQSADGWSGGDACGDRETWGILRKKSATSEEFLPWEDLKRFRVKQLIRMDWKWLDCHKQYSLGPSSPEPGNAPVGDDSSWQSWRDRRGTTSGLEASAGAGEQNPVPQGQAATASVGVHYPGPWIEL